LALMFWLAGSTISWCQPNIMQFSAYPPTPIAEKLMGNNQWTIFATGEIDADAGKRLAKLIADKRIPTISSLLYLHSPGGSLLGGMDLGRVIRNNLLVTYIGRLNAAADIVEPGYCYSACALAFLGGEYRYQKAQFTAYTGSFGKSTRMLMLMLRK